jgi:hypothetical protein
VQDVGIDGRLFALDPEPGPGLGVGFEGKLAPGLGADEHPAERCLLLQSGTDVDGASPTTA